MVRVRIRFFFTFVADSIEFGRNQIKASCWVELDTMEKGAEKGERKNRIGRMSRTTILRIKGLRRIQKSAHIRSFSHRMSIPSIQNETASVRERESSRECKRYRCRSCESVCRPSRCSHIKHTKFLWTLILNGKSFRSRSHFEQMSLSSSLVSRTQTRHSRYEIRDAISHQ